MNCNLWRSHVQVFAHWETNQFRMSDNPWVPEAFRAPTSSQRRGGGRLPILKNPKTCFCWEARFFQPWFIQCNRQIQGGNVPGASSEFQPVCSHRASFDEKLRTQVESNSLLLDVFSEFQMSQNYYSAPDPLARVKRAVTWHGRSRKERGKRGEEGRKGERGRNGKGMK